MIVRDRGDAWQIVYQPDHADLSGRIAEAWGVSESLRMAAEHHDDGWATWERVPTLNDGNPRVFFQAPLDTLLVLYEGSVRAVADADEYAGALIGMHFAGLFSGRYGQHDPPPNVTPEMQAFVDRMNALAADVSTRHSIDEQTRMDDYRLLQVFDIVSLVLCLDSNPDQTIPLVPGMPDGLRLTGDSDWNLVLDPFPFAGDAWSSTLVRYLVPKDAFSDEPSYRAALRAAEPDTVEVTLHRG